MRVISFLELEALDYLYVHYISREREKTKHKRTLFKFQVFLSSPLALSGRRPDHERASQKSKHECWRDGGVLM
jgi:hypothetical protein